MQLLSPFRELAYGGIMSHEPDLAPGQPIVILATPRLILRAATESDIPILYERVFGDGDVMRHAFSGVVMPREEAENFIRTSFTFGESHTGIATLIEKETNDLIGFAGLLACNALGADDFEIGFVLARTAWGRGLATEIGEAQLAFGFERLNCGRLLGLAHPQNTPSIHALKKLGLKYLTNVEDANRPVRSVYCMGADEWRARQTFG